jgi:hypothetical protein
LEFEEKARMWQTATEQGNFQSLTIADFHGNLWETDDLTDSQLRYDYGTRVAISLKGAAVRPFKQPCPVSWCYFFQQVGLLFNHRITTHKGTQTFITSAP